MSAVDDAARKLAHEMFQSEERKYAETFVQAPGEGERVVVFAVRTSKIHADFLREILEDDWGVVTKSVAKPKGTVCPTCGGTGKI